jgi:ferritin
VQSQEKDEHAMNLFDFVNARQGLVMLQPISQPMSEFQSPLEVMQQTLEHERQVSQLIHRLYGVAVKEGDYPTQVHLQWFIITEQVEEEKVASNIVEQLKMIGGKGDALLLLDRELGGRMMAPSIIGRAVVQKMA